MIGLRPYCAIGLSLAAAWGISLAAGQQPTVPGPFTEGQARAGREAYTAQCAGCHQPDLRGSGEAPALAGANFISTWGNQTVADLFGRIKSSMPPGRGGSIDDSTCLAIVAHILQSNGSGAGSQPLTASAPVRIDSIASGQAPAPQAAQGNPAPAAAGRGRSGQEAVALPRGLTVPGEVQELRAGHRRDVEESRPGRLADGPAQLSGVERQPAHAGHDRQRARSRLAWGWAMNDGGSGRNQPTPLVHNGIMYMLNLGHTVQALDARTGDRSSGRTTSDPRSTTCAAQHGDLREQRVHGDQRRAAGRARRAQRQGRLGDARSQTTRKGYLNSSGPIVINGKVIQGLGGCDEYSEAGCYISAYDAATGKQLWKFYTVAREGTPGGDTLGQACRTCSAPAEIHGSPAATIPTSISRTGGSRSPSRGCPRAAG